MQKISGKKIILTRGDTFKAIVGMVNENGEEYVPEQGDSIRFAMKEHYDDETVLLEKTIPNDTLLLHIEPNDTKELPFGDYKYDIQLTYANGDVDTLL